MNFGDSQYTKKKNRRKFLRVILQVLILAGVVFILLTAIFTYRKYKPFQERGEDVAIEDKGFVALSYFGVSRIGTKDLISKNRLEEHLQALKNSGYETITQQDIIDYYEHGDNLPRKSLFLMFEDGRRDTAIFVQPLLEKYNYKSSIMTYVEKFELKDTKFLMPRELKDLEHNSFWELGTNGYRLAFINCYDRYDNYLGELTPLKHVLVAPYMSRKYNHFLMDYLRDKDYFPKESYDMMQDRISYDYEKLRDVYNKDVGYVPQAYVLMHSNTGAFGNNREVSAVNEKWITELFSMNFNREGYSWNDRSSIIYDLTRMQPQPYWYANHLLMRIAHDQSQPVKFVRGKLDEAEKWSLNAGECEFKDEKIVLTTEPHGNSRIYLRHMRNSADVRVKTILTGNKYGTQSIYLRADENLTEPLAVKIFGNYLYVRENGQELYKLDLDKFDDKKPVSVDEDKKAAEVAALRTFARYAPTKKQAEFYAQRMALREQQPADSVADGAKEFKKEIGLNELGKRELEIILRGNKMRLKVDGKDISTTIEVQKRNRGRIALEASTSDLSWSQRNLADDVYDGVFEKLMIYDLQAAHKPEPFFACTIAGHSLELFWPWAEETGILYDSRLHGFAGVLHTLNEYWEKVLEFFIHTF